MLALILIISLVRKQIFFISIFLIMEGSKYSPTKKYVLNKLNFVASEHVYMLTQNHSPAMKIFPITSATYMYAYF